MGNSTTGSHEKIPIGVRDYALVRIGETLCAVPHGEPGPDGQPRAGMFLLRRVVPWRMPTPVPGTPSNLVLGVAPLGDEDGIEHVEVVVDLAAVLDLPSLDTPRGVRACILTYDDGDLVVGLVVDALEGRVQLVPPTNVTSLPFTAGLVFPAQEHLGAQQEWRVIDVNALIRHIAALLRAPVAA